MQIEIIEPSISLRQWQFVKMVVACEQIVKGIALQQCVCAIVPYVSVSWLRMRVCASGIEFALCERIRADLNIDFEIIVDFGRNGAIRRKSEHFGLTLSPFSSFSHNRRRSIWIWWKLVLQFLVNITISPHLHIMYENRLIQTRDACVLAAGELRCHKTASEMCLS